MTASLGAIPPTIPGGVPAVMVAPSRLPVGEEWVQTCLHDGGGLVCGARIQGGVAGLRAHVRVVHRSP